jgi:hypothetical protein
MKLPWMFYQPRHAWYCWTNAWLAIATKMVTIITFCYVMPSWDTLHFIRKWKRYIKEEYSNRR